MAVVLNIASARRIGRYELVRYLGSGGMSEIHEAVHTGLKRKVALKLLHPSLRGDEDAVERFLREGECAARIAHPNVVSVYDVGVDAGVPFLVMELLQGECLETQLTRRGPLSVTAAVDLFLPICRAVAAAHAAGVIHRDIKPANVFLVRTSDGGIMPKLVDFGVATLTGGARSAHASGPIGTPQYMSPEQARGSAFIDERTDQYSLASLLYEMLTGNEPYSGTDVDSVLRKVARAQFPSLSRSVMGAPRALEAVLARATSPSPQGRYGSVTELAEALLPFASRQSRTEWHAAAQGSVAAEPRALSVPPQSSVGLVGRERDASRITLRAAPVRRSRPPRPHRTALVTVVAFALLVGLLISLASSSERALPSQDGAMTAVSSAHRDPAPQQESRTEHARGESEADSLLLRVRRALFE